jgi:hypothetical protein
MDYHVMPNNFNSLFSCGCEVTNVEEAGKESCQHIISESAFVKLIQETILLLFCKQLEKNVGMFRFLELFRAETKCKSQPWHMKQQYFVQIKLVQF